MHGGGDPNSAQHETVVGRRTAGLVRVPGSKEGVEEPVTGSVPGEHPARPVRAVGGGSESDDVEPGAWIAESRHRASPVSLTLKRASWVRREALAPVDEAGTPLTLDDLSFEPPERVDGVAGVGHFYSLRSFG